MPSVDWRTVQYCTGRLIGANRVDRSHRINSECALPPPAAACLRAGRPFHASRAARCARAHAFHPIRPHPPSHLISHRIIRVAAMRNHTDAEHCVLSNVAPVHRHSASAISHTALYSPLEAPASQPSAPNCPAAAGRTGRHPKAPHRKSPLLKHPAFVRRVG